MATKRLVVDERIPFPGRKLINLVQRTLNAAKPQAMHFIREGQIKINGRPALSPSMHLKPGDVLTVELPEPRAPSLKKQQPTGRLQIIYEDAHLAVVEKPPGLLTVPTPRREAKTLLSLLQQRWQRAEPNTVVCCVHRLDRSVSGLLVFAKSVAIAEALRNQFEQRKPERVYIAICRGVLREPVGTIRSYMATDRKTLNRYSTSDSEKGELAITHYRLLHSGRDDSTLEVRLETGRRNQIRVHFADAEHPILGDTRYGRNFSPAANWPHQRLALHAMSLGFEHPVTGKAMYLTSKLPREFYPFLPPAERK